MIRRFYEGELSFQWCLLLTETHYTRLHHEDTISLLFRKHNPKGNKSYKGNCFNICMRLKEEQIKIFLTFKRHSLPQNEKSVIIYSPSLYFVVSFQKIYSIVFHGRKSDRFCIPLRHEQSHMHLQFSFFISVIIFLFQIMIFLWI